MAFQPLTVEDILESLPIEEQKEILRDDFRIPLQLYLKAFNRNPYMDREGCTKTFRQFARNRSAVRQEIIRNPDLQKTPVESPVVIIGLQRSGTTLLQRLLSVDDQFLSPMLWEMIDSTPPGRPDNWRDSIRYNTTLERASDLHEYQHITGKGLDNLHKIRLDLSVECQYIMRQYFLDTLEGLPVGIHGEWRKFMYNCPESHVKNAYEFHKNSLRCIFHENLKEGKSLLLKGSVHALHLDAFKEAYPKAKFIFLYRDMKDVLASYTSLKFKQLEPFKLNTEEYLHGLALRIKEVLNICSSRVVDAFKKWNKDDYMAICFKDLVSNPMETVEKIYSFIDLELTPEGQEATQHYLANNPKSKNGHISLEKMGIDEDDLKKEFSEYKEYFEI